MKRNAIFATLLALGSLGLRLGPQGRGRLGQERELLRLQDLGLEVRRLDPGQGLGEALPGRAVRPARHGRAEAGGPRQRAPISGPSCTRGSPAETQVVSYDPGWGYGWGVWGPSYTEVYQIPVGTILVDLVDAKQKQAVWQGKAHGYISANKTNEEREQKLISIIAEMFAGYPPGDVAAN